MPTRFAFPLLLCLLAILVAGCRTPGKPAPEESAPTIESVLPPAITRGEFTIEADKLDTWNAIGQIAVRTPGVDYQGRAQMMDLYVLRYRDVEFLLLTKALPAETGAPLTTKVTAATPAGEPIDHDAVAELLALFQRELPAEIESVRARQAVEKKAKAKKSGKKKKSKS